jgi:hypothetical protein
MSRSENDKIHLSFVARRAVEAAVFQANCATERDKTQEFCRVESMFQTATKTTKWTQLARPKVVACEVGWPKLAWIASRAASAEPRP